MPKSRSSRSALALQIILVYYYGSSTGAAAMCSDVTPYKRATVVLE